MTYLLETKNSAVDVMTEGADVLCDIDSRWAVDLAHLAE
jgi:hypothetical protein